MQVVRCVRIRHCIGIADRCAWHSARLRGETLLRVNVNCAWLRRCKAQNESHSAQWAHETGNAESAWTLGGRAVVQRPRPRLGRRHGPQRGLAAGGPVDRARHLSSRAFLSAATLPRVPRASRNAKVGVRPKSVKSLASGRAPQRRPHALGYATRAHARLELSAFNVPTVTSASLRREQEAPTRQRNGGDSPA